jgi:hypothetical protein
MYAMGAWVAGTLIVFVIATQNFYTVDRLLTDSANAAFRAQVDSLGTARGRELLRYLSSELNRLYFQLWNGAQLALGVVVLWLPGRSRQHVRSRNGVLVMVALVSVMTLWLQPEITSLGRSLDFVPRDPEPPGMSRFWMLHAIYTTLEVCKLVLGVTVAVWLARTAGAATSKEVALR